MRSLMRALAVVGVVAFAAPALACSEMQQTTAEKKVEKPAVAKAVKAKKLNKAPATTIAKAQVARPAAN